MKRIGMKKLGLASMMTLAMVAGSSHVKADRSDAELYQPSSEGSLSAIATTILGGVIAGPVGLVIGAFTGQALSDEISKADQYDEVVSHQQSLIEQLADAKRQVVFLEQDLAQQERDHRALQQFAMHSLEFQVLFQTGGDTLHDNEINRLDELAEFLQRNPQLNVRLHGYADPRGTDEYNNVLSQYRSQNVGQVLKEKGIDPIRIEQHAYGSNHSTATKGDLDAYALERRVLIEVYDAVSDIASVKP